MKYILYMLSPIIFIAVIAAWSHLLILLNNTGIVANVIIFGKNRKEYEDNSFSNTIIGASIWGGLIVIIYEIVLGMKK